MTPFDYAVLVILLASMALGAWRGVLGEIIAKVLADAKNAGMVKIGFITNPGAKQ